MTLDKMILKEALEEAAKSRRLASEPCGTCHGADGQFHLILNLGVHPAVVNIKNSRLPVSFWNKVWNRWEAYR